MEKFKVDCLIIGGGVAGIASAKYLAKDYKEIFLIEKNNDLGLEASSRNSEVIHAGIYYKKESLKSALCIRGKKLLYDYLEMKNISFAKCGKFVVASSLSEIDNLMDIKSNAEECGIFDLKFEESKIKEYPFLKSEAFLYSPSSGIFDSSAYINSLRSDFEQSGGTVLFGNEFIGIEKENSFFNVLIKDTNNKQEYIIQTGVLINAGGIQSCQIANEINEKIIFESDLIKGEYYSYCGKEKINHLIYPVPKKESLGAHATIDLGKGIRFGPSAYRVNKEEYDLDENHKQNFLSEIKKYWPKINEKLLMPDYSGIRAKIKNQDDFFIDINQLGNKVAVNILGYISPGLTSSLGLAEFIRTSLKEL